MSAQIRKLRWLCRVLGFVFAFQLTISTAFGLDFGQRSAASLVQEALHREVYSSQSERNALLEQAAKQQPNLPRVRWHRGYVEIEGRWISIDDVPQISQRIASLSQYEEKRNAAGQTVAGQFALATWCGENQLQEQQRAHLENLLDEAPDHAAARALLGYRLIDGQWYSRDAIGQQARQRELERQAFRRWGREIKSIADLMNSKRPKKQQLAAELLNKIEAVEVIPVLERDLAYESHTAGLLVVEWLANQSGQAVVDALIRQAVLSPWTSVQNEAATQLRAYERSRFVPQMLEMMVTPVSSQFAFAPSQRGMVYQTLFKRETNQEQQELLLQREYIRRRRAGGDGRMTLARAVLDSWNLGTNWQLAVNRQNAQAESMNQRVATALTIATSQQLEPRPLKWWQWWNDQQDYELQGPKQRRQVQRGDQVTVVDIVPQQTAGGSQSSARPARAECFAAGTDVWTTRGRRPIECIQVGDLVLSQDVESGELSYKPVLRTTVRQPEPLVQVEVDRETFATTPGHLFWVSGNAWQQARKLTSAQPLHAVNGITTVLSVQPIPAEKTYNLVVADFHTYFVGASRVLSHDVTSPRPVDVVVPGLLSG